MHAAVDDRYYSYYAYDHSGERRLKLTGKNDLLDVNAEVMATFSVQNKQTLYPSAYMVLTDKGYTNVAKAESRACSHALPRRSSVTGRKHYYAGTERVAARLGGGGLDAMGYAVGNDEELRTKANKLFKQSLEQVNSRVLQENDLDCIMNSEFAKEEFAHPIDGIPLQMKAKVELDHRRFKDMVNTMLADLDNGQEDDVYFYHSDLCKSREQIQAGLSYAETQQSVRSKHLGSASWITDYSGTAVQHLQYLPFGEPFVNEHATGAGYSERFTFTGKERDEETGYGYFGARYMDHELMTMWLSVDPLADKYPGISPYAYCAWNPVKLVDENGEEFIGALIGAAIGATSEIISQTISNGIQNCQNGVVFFKDWGNQIDWADVAIEGAMGALDGLVPGTSKLAKGSLSVAKELTKTTVDLRAGEGFSVPTNKDEVIESCVDFITNIATSATCSGLSILSGQKKLPNPYKSGDFGGIALGTLLDGTINGVFGASWSMAGNSIKEYYQNKSISKPILLPEVNIRAGVECDGNGKINNVGARKIYNHSRKYSHWGE